MRPASLPLPLAEILTAFHSIIQKQLFSSTLIRANGVSRDRAVHSSKMSWWKIAKASAPPCEPTPVFLIASCVVRSLLH